MSNNLLTALIFFYVTFYFKILYIDLDNIYFIVNTNLICKKLI